MWRGAAIALFSITVTLLGGWLTIGDNIVSGAEIDKKIQYAVANDEYSRDERDIKRRLANLEALSKSVSDLRDAVVDLTAQVKQLVEADRHESADKRRDINGGKFNR